MPRIDSQGQVWAGVGDGIVSLDKVEVARGGGAMPLDENRGIFGGHWTEDGKDVWRTLVYDKRTKQVTKLSDVDAQFLVASAGEYFVSGSNGSGASFPVTPATRITPASTDGRGAADQQGTIALSDITGQGFVLRSKDGNTTSVIAPGFPMYNLTVVGPLQALWPAAGVFATLRLPTIKVVGPPGRGCYCIVKERPWVVYYTDGFGLIAHPADDASKILTIAKDNFFHYDAIAFNDTIRVTYSLTTAERPGDVVIEDLDLSKLEAVVKPAPVEVPVPAPKPMANINVKSWDPELVTGKPWQATVEVAGVTVTVKKDEKDRLWFESPNATPTGAVRQLALTPVAVGTPVPVPEPPPEPPKPEPPNQVPVPVRDSRFWLAPRPAAPDLNAIFDDPSRLNNVGVFQFYVQEILNDEPVGGFGSNGYNHLKEVLPKLRALGIAVGVEMGSVKQEDPDASNNTGSLEAVLQRTNADYISMDEPLTSAHKLKVQPETVAPAVSKFIARAKELKPSVKVGWIEAYPEVSFDEIHRLYNALTVKPDFIRLDVDWNRAAKEHQDPAAFFQALKGLSLPISVLVNATQDPLPSDEAHDLNLQALATKLHGIIPDASQVVVQSWETVPNNLGEHGLLATFQKVVAIFAGTVPVPQPVPQESPVLKSTVSEQPIVIKAVKPITGTKLSTLILPDDKVYSCQPDGSDDVRPAGAEGQYEKCKVEGNLATFKPVEKTYFTKPIVNGDEL